jgi:hypothetical protein
MNFRRAVAKYDTTSTDARSRSAFRPSVRARVDCPRRDFDAFSTDAT